MKSFPFIKQLDSQDCGLACLKMVSKYYGVLLSDSVFSESNISKRGITISDLKYTSEELGFDALPVKLSYEEALSNINVPSVFFWNQNHFIVVYKMTPKKVYVADPAFGKTVYTKEQFLKGWTQEKEKGIILILEPTENLHEKSDEHKKNTSRNLQYITQYIKKHKTQFLLIAITLLVSSCIELIFPFFTQKILDKGVALKQINLIYLILAAQIGLFLSRVGLEYYRSWLFIHISSRISLSIISDFLAKLMKLPLKFFNSKNTGDLLQRIQDHKRIEEFLSQDLIQTVFSFFSIIIYSFVLLYFNPTIFFVVLIGTSLELTWIFNFFKKIKILDQKTFSLQSTDQNKIYEIINSMQEIKLNNLEDHKRNEWSSIQSNIYLNNIEKLKVNQKYESYKFINFFQNMLVVFTSSLSVMNGQMTIGTMLSIVYIIGGMNNPISQLITFFLRYHLVKISFERLNEIHNKEDEENISKIDNLERIYDISIQNLSFSYDNTHFILNDINLSIPKGRTTAIVGASGSGKTSLLKLILKFYNPQMGNISLEGIPLKEIENIIWREKCGVILQDSYIFSDTVAYNIALEENPDKNKLKNAIALANISDFIDFLPLKIDTIIGSEGIGLSQGQKQRILIARAIYKDPDYLFFDEATNSLDAKNERIIVQNIDNFFKNKTMIVVAHRLSTVKNADQIIVLDSGRIVEQGNHDELIHIRGKYFELIQNQLELGL